MHEGTVLAVEDNKYNRMVLKKVTEFFGYPCLIFTSGAAFLDYFKTHSDECQVILMDIHIPIMSGHEIMEFLEEHYPDHPPVIAISADIQEQYRYHERGYVDFILKPFDINAFDNVLKKYVKPLPNRFKVIRTPSPLNA